MASRTSSGVVESFRRSYLL